MKMKIAEKNHTQGCRSPDIRNGFKIHQKRSPSKQKAAAFLNIDHNDEAEDIYMEDLNQNRICEIKPTNFREPARSENN